MNKNNLKEKLLPFLLFQKTADLIVDKNLK